MRLNKQAKPTNLDFSASLLQFDLFLWQKYSPFSTNLASSYPFVTVNMLPRQFTSYMGKQLEGIHISLLALLRRLPLSTLLFSDHLTINFKCLLHLVSRFLRTGRRRNKLGQSVVTSNYFITYRQTRLPILCMHLFLSHERVVADTAQVRHPTALATTLIHALFKSGKQFTHQQTVKERYL